MKKRKGTFAQGVREALSEEALIQLAEEPVPLGSGYQNFGSGPYAYGKMARDGSMREFRFQSPELVQRAMMRSMAADVAAMEEQISALERCMN